MNKKIYEAVISGRSDNNIRFTDFQNLIVDLGFEFQRQKGSHCMYYNINIDVLMNVQPHINKAKDYQVKQLRNIIKKYRLKGE